MAAGKGITRFNAAVAYATTSGVDTLVKAMPPQFQKLNKRWLVGIDWYRSQPDALDALAALPRSAVRIHDGAAIAGRAGCVPRVSFHPKGFLFLGTRVGALAVGSGNLSRNGMTRGHEAAVEIVAPTSTRDWQVIGAAETWFDAIWNAATSYAQIERLYRARYTAAPNLSRPTPTDDDAFDASALRPRGFSQEHLATLRVCQNLWIEAGNLHHNRGRGLPGNQLMLRAQSRVFFGFPALNLPIDTKVGEVAIRVGSTVHDDRSLRFSNNSMDVLALPVPGPGTFPAYDGETLHFQRSTVRGRVVFNLALGSATAAARWRHLSSAIRGSFTMPGGRRFGVF